MLILAGDPGLGSAVCEELDRYHVWGTAVTSVEAAHERLREGRYAAIVVDLCLSDGAGYRFVADLRAAGGIQPVLLLSAPDAPEDLLGVQRAPPGAQPAVREGLHDVPHVLQALLRHERSDSARRLRYAGLLLDRFERRACVDGIEVALTPAEFAILEQLVLNAEHLVTREALLAAVWREEQDPASNALAVHLCHVRKKLRRREARVVI
ncbi:MAG: response regulator transcription factor, partial [Gammaproteobacteria bacterium]|nr:response regulator transcription factor [Gammaproteobacteria bacterium]